MVGFFDYSAAGDVGESVPDLPATGTFLAGCSTREWQALQEHSTVEIVARDANLIRQGERDRDIFIVLAGSFAPTDGGPVSGNRVRLLPGDVFGEIAFFDGLPRTSTVVALEASRIMRIRYQAFEALAASEPVLARMLLMDLGRAMASRLRVAGAEESQ